MTTPAPPEPDIPATDLPPPPSPPLNNPSPNKPWPNNTSANADDRRARTPGPTPWSEGGLRSLTGVLARHAARARSGGAVRRNVLRALLLTLVAAAAAAPFAVAWGVGHAQVADYLGPHQVTFAATYSGEVKLDLGPIGNAYLPSPAAPVGLDVIVGGVGAASQGVGSLLSPQTLAAYSALYHDPQDAIRGMVERLVQNAVVRSVEAEGVLLATFALWKLRDQLLAPWVARHLTRRRTAGVYLAVVAVTVGSILVPSTPAGTRIPVTVALGDVRGLTVDSVLLSDLLGRGVQGVTILTAREQASVDHYVADATVSLSRSLGRLPRAAPGETMLMGFSDLHCNQAMAQLLTRLARVAQPRIVLSSGDDTVQGLSVERGCIRRESQIPDGVPFVVATGNHDSDITETQMRTDGMVVLDGGVVSEAGLAVLGDDDPERQIPFTVDRTRDRAETEQEMALRLVGAAKLRRVDVLMVHQPASALVALQQPDPPVRLLTWGHFHAQDGPRVVAHADGSWTVGMQQGTAGGVKQPTITSFSTPFSPPLISADVYFYFRDDATGLVTGVQPVHFLPEARVVVEDRIVTGDPTRLPASTRARLVATPSPSPAGR